jgi:hypothetical protein
MALLLMLPRRGSCPLLQEGGVGDLKYPLVADLKKQISESFGVLSEDGIALRGLFIIDKEGVVQHATINNLAFGRSVDETLRTLQVRRHKISCCLQLLKCCSWTEAAGRPCFYAMLCYAFVAIWARQCRWSCHAEAWAQAAAPAAALLRPHAY